MNLINLILAGAIPLNMSGNQKKLPVLAISTASDSIELTHRTLFGSTAYSPKGLDNNEYYFFDNILIPITTEEFINPIEEIKMYINNYDGSIIVKENTNALIEYLSFSDIELPDVSSSEEGSIIFESYNSGLHYAIEIFDSGLISYFTNRNGNDEFHNFKNLEDIKTKLVEDFGIAQLQ